MAVIVYVELGCCWSVGSVELKDDEDGSVEEWMVISPLYILEDNSNIRRIPCHLIAVHPCRSLDSIALVE
jgi:hypothetical protein